MRTIFTLVRHGETEWNRSSRWQGHSDIALSDLGREQSRCLSRRLHVEKVIFNAMYSSDLSRAAETAQILGAALGLQPRVVAAFRELDVGTWSGLLNSEVASRYPEEWKRICADEDLPRGGAERLADLAKRACEAFDGLVAEHAGQHVCIVTHNGVIRTILLHVQKLPLCKSNDLGQIYNTSLTRLCFDGRRWEVDCFNDVIHLKDFKPPVDMLSL